MIYKKICCCLLLSLFIARLAQAQNKIDLKYFTFSQSLESQLVSEKIKPYADLPITVPLLNMGQTVWYIIKEGRPVLNHESAKATALPIGAKHWTDLQNWRPLKKLPFKVVYKNLYGQTVINLDCELLLLYGGEFNQQGRYIGITTVVSKAIEVAFMYQLDVKVEVLSVHQMPSYLKPVAEIILNIQWQIQNPLKNEIKSQSFILNGFGEVIKT